MNPLVITALVVLAAAAYAVSLIWHPYVPCRACQGTGKDRDPIWRRAYGDCPACSGAGRKPRAGVRLFLHATYKRRGLRGQRK